MSKYKEQIELTKVLLDNERSFISRIQELEKANVYGSVRVTLDTSYEHGIDVEKRRTYIASSIEKKLKAKYQLCCYDVPYRNSISFVVRWSNSPESNCQIGPNV